MSSELTPEDALIAAKEAIGGGAALGRCFNPPISPQAVHKWDRAPVERVLDIERATGISRHLLRPDIYPVEDREAAE